MKNMAEKPDIGPVKAEKPAKPAVKKADKPAGNAAAPAAPSV